MLRTILINEIASNDLYARAYATKEQAVAALKRLAKRYGYDPTDIVADSGCGPRLFLITEQAGGLWVGFSNTHQASICGPISTILEDDFLGNGDPRFYFTNDQPAGSKIKAVRSVTGVYPHPIYQEWLAIHGYTQDDQIIALLDDLRNFVDKLDNNISTTHRHDLCAECRNHIELIKSQLKEQISVLSHHKY